jgi:hypothetical protein
MLTAKVRHDNRVHFIAPLPFLVDLGHEPAPLGSNSTRDNQSSHTSDAPLRGHIFLTSGI